MLAYNMQQVAICVLASIMSSELDGQVSMYAHAQLSCVYPSHYAHDRIYQALPLLNGESLGMKLQACLKWAIFHVNFPNTNAQ